MSEEWKADRQKDEDPVVDSKNMPDLAETDYLEEREELTEERILEMLEERQYKELKEELENNMYPIDLADILENFDQKHLVMVFRLLAKEEAAETFTYMNSDMREPADQCTDGFRTGRSHGRDVLRRYGRRSGRDAGQCGGQASDGHG